MRRRLLLTASTTCAVALLAGAWATGGLRAAPRTRSRAAMTPVDLGRYELRVTDAVVRYSKRIGSLFVVTLRVTAKDDRSVPVQDLAVNALSLDVPRGTRVIPISATASSQGVEVSLLNPRVPATVTLTYGLGRRPAPAGFRSRLSLWRYEHREDFFYGHRRWISRKPTDAKGYVPADFLVPLPIRRENA